MSDQNTLTQALVNALQRVTVERTQALIELEQARLRIAELEARVSELEAAGGKPKAEDRPALREVTKDR